MQVKLKIVMPIYSQLISKVRLYINECVISHLRSDKWTTGFQGIKINSVIFWWLMKSICPFIHVCPMIMYVVVYAFIGFTYLQLNIRATLLCLLSIMKIHWSSKDCLLPCLVEMQPACNQCKLWYMLPNLIFTQPVFPTSTDLCVCMYTEREKERKVTCLCPCWTLMTSCWCYLTL